jgi:hypothetical protein
MHSVLVDCKSVQKVDFFLFVLFYLRSYFNAGKIEYNSFLNYSRACKRKGDDAEGSFGQMKLLRSWKGLPAYSTRHI